MTRWVVGVCWLASAALAKAPTVVIDPGHGGRHDGASGAGTLEKHLCLDLSKRLAAALVDELGARVVLTRGKDVSMPLSSRVAFANEQQPDLFISVHANSMPTARLRESTEGVETYFLSANASGEAARHVAARENADAPTVKGPKADTLAYILADLQRSEAHHDSSRLAYAVHPKLVAAMGAVDRGVQQAPFYVLMGVEAPAILLEVGFISHPDEGPRLLEEARQEAIARAVAQGVKEFLRTSGERPGTRAASP